MDISVMLPIFTSIFLAELGDKTQLATVFFVAAGGYRKSEVFLASSLALLASTLLAVLFGAAVASLISPRLSVAGAGLIFVVMGVMFIVSSLTNAGDKGGQCA